MIRQTTTMKEVPACSLGHFCMTVFVQEDMWFAPIHHHSPTTGYTAVQKL